MKKIINQFAALLLLASISAGVSSCEIEGPDTDDIVKYQATINNKGIQPSTTSSAQGSASFEYSKSKNTLTYSITYQGLTPNNVTINRAEPFFENGPIVFELKNFATSPLTGTLSLNSDQETDLRLGRMYVLIWTKENPYGEIRGQIRPVPINEP